MARVSRGIEMLKKRADFVAASRDGVKVGGPVVALQMRDRVEPDRGPRIGFTVTKRVGGAVERNRMKRRLRAAVRETVDDAVKAGCDYVVVARRAVLDVDFKRLKRDLAEAVKRANGRSRAAGRDTAAGRPVAERPESGR